MDEVLFFVFLVVGLNYLIIVLGLNIGWFRLKEFNNNNVEIYTKVTVIIAARNEEANILNCLNSIAKQNFPAQLLEVIIVDDNSSDNTTALITTFIQSCPLQVFKLIRLNFAVDGLTGKKTAITKAVHEANGSLIVSTDADCVSGKNWLSDIVVYYQNTGAAFISAPVIYHNEKSIFQKLQSMEFLSLVASGAASIKMGFPIMCNGANLAFGKKEFIEVGGYDTNLKYASGDDMFLMMKMKNKFPQRIHFLKSKNATIFTEALENLKSFYNQRKRWVSKSRGYADFSVLYSAFTVFLFNFLVVSAVAGGFWYEPLFVAALLLISLKTLADFPIMISAMAFAGKRKYLYLYIPVQILYAFYIVFFTFAGLIGKYNWKERRNV